MLYIQKVLPKTASVPSHRESFFATPLQTFLIFVVALNVFLMFSPDRAYSWSLATILAKGQQKEKSTSPFICQINEINARRPLLLVGEDHQNKESVAVKRLLFSLAEEQKIYLATEVGQGFAALPWDRFGQDHFNEYIFPLESPIPFAIMASFFIQYDNYHREQSVIQLLRETIMSIHALPLLASAYRIVKNNTSCRFCTALIDYNLEKLKTSKDRNDNWQILIKFVNPNQYTFNINPEMVREFITSWYVQVINLAQEKYADKLNNAELEKFKNLVQQDERSDEFRRGGSFEILKITHTLDKILMNTRNNDFSESIARILCFQGSEQKPLIVLLGADHMYEVRYLVQHLVHGGEGLHFQMFQSFYEGEAERLIHQLKQY